MSVGIVILVLLIAGLALLRHAPLPGLAFLVIAACLLFTTPVGSGIPGAVTRGAQTVSETTGHITGGGPR